MKPALKRTSEGRSNLMPSAIALALTAMVGGGWATPAHAQYNDRDRGHEVSRGHHDSNRHRGSSYVAPAYVYAPPPVYYAPPQAPPVIDFVFPLHFR